MVVVKMVIGSKALHTGSAVDSKYGASGVDLRVADGSVRILVVDDEEDIRQTMALVLRNEGYCVDLASTGKETIEKTQSTAYNLIILDIRLPDIDGVTVLSKIHDTVPKTRKIMLTGFPSQQNAITSLNNKADAYLVKPVDVSELLAVIYRELKCQEEEKHFSEQKVTEFIMTRVKELESKESCR